VPRRGRGYLPVQHVTREGALAIYACAINRASMTGCFASWQRWFNVKKPILAYEAAVTGWQ
jgi:hypothetical protein